MWQHDHLGIYLDLNLCKNNNINNIYVTCYMLTAL